MNNLSKYKQNLQALTELIKFSLGMDVFVVDDHMVARSARRIPMWM
jgi:hypothetical protein